MIGYLKGTIIDKSLSSATVLVGGVGYDVSMPSNMLGNLSQGEESEIFVHTHVKEDALSLYGFDSKDSLEFFKMLLSVSGIGPKVALSILASAPIDQLKSSISQGDATMLSAVSGVGKKTAEKTVIELKGKIGSTEIHAISQLEGSEDIIEALSGLGFQRQEVIEGIRNLPADTKTADEKIKYLIKNLGKNR